MYVVCVCKIIQPESPPANAQSLYPILVSCLAPLAMLVWRPTCRCCRLIESRVHTNMQTRMPPPIRYGYERTMSIVLPCILLLFSLLALCIEYEYVLVPWRGRLAGETRGIFIGQATLILLAWYSYLVCRMSDAGSVPPEMRDVGARLPPEVRSSKNWCEHCQNVKPPRCHHCRRCNKFDLGHGEGQVTTLFVC